MKKIDLIVSIRDINSQEKIIDGCNGNIYNILSSFNFESEQELLDEVIGSINYRIIALFYDFFNLNNKGKKISYDEESKKYVIKDIDK